MGYNRFSLILAGLVYARNYEVFLLSHFDLCAVSDGLLLQGIWANAVVPALQSSRIGESLCGAFYHLSLLDLQTYLSTLWNDVIQSSGQQYQILPSSPWIMDHNAVSFIINPAVSPTNKLPQVTSSGNSQTAYSNRVDPSILNNILRLIPTMAEDYKRALLRTLRRGFLLRLMLDSRDISSGPCHNMLWTTSHFVSSYETLMFLSFHITISLGSLG